MKSILLTLSTLFVLLSFSSAAEPLDKSGSTVLTVCVCPEGKCTCTKEGTSPTKETNENCSCECDCPVCFGAGCEKGNCKCPRCDCGKCPEEEKNAYPKMPIDTDPADNSCRWNESGKCECPASDCASGKCKCPKYDCGECPSEKATYPEMPIETSQPDKECEEDNSEATYFDEEISKNKCEEECCKPKHP